MPTMPRENDGDRELEYADAVSQCERRQLRAHIRFLEERCAALEEELSALRGSREAGSAPRLLALAKKIDRAAFLFEKALLALTPMSRRARLRRKERLLERYRDSLAADDPLRNLLLRRELREQLAATAAPFLPADLPLTSVIVLYDGDPGHLERCRLSIEAAPPRAPFELLLAAPSRRVPRGIFPDARVVAADSGRCELLDLAAREARGEYLLFLDGAAEVLPGWLDELALALYRHPGSGPVGARIVDPETGRVRSSGYLLRADGTPAPRGEGAALDLPGFSYFREADFCSGAGLIVRKEHFAAAGGFDPADGALAAAGLALRCRRKGWTTSVMPLAAILADRDDPAPTEAERASIAALRAELPPESAPARRIFYADAEVPMPDRGSGGMDAFFFMERMIRAGYQVVFFGENMPRERRRYENDLERLGVEVLRPTRVKIADYLREYGHTFDLVFVSRVYVAQKLDRLLRLYAPQAAYVFDTVDLHFVRERREAELADSDDLRLRALMTEVLELTIASRADAAIVISSEEKTLLEREYGLANVRHIPQARERFGCRTPFAERRGIVFVGSAHPPNLDALKFYVTEILPLLEAEGIDGTLTVIGEALRNGIFSDEKYRCVAESPKIRFVGYAADLGEYYDRAAISVAPLRYGAGTKGKIASSMAYGVPCVSTRFGTEGTGMVDGENVRIADTPEAFAGAMKELLTDVTLWRKISDGGLKFLKEHYDPEAVGALTDDVIAAALAHKRATDGAFALVKNAGELAAATAVGAGEIRSAEAFLRCEPRGGASILAETLREEERRELERRFRSIFFVGDVSEMRTGKYDFLLLGSHPQPELCERLKAAKHLLYDGGRVIFPPPPESDAPALWTTILDEIGFQQLFLVRAEPGAAPCLCAVKAIPGGEGGF